MAMEHLSDAIRTKKPSLMMCPPYKFLTGKQSSICDEEVSYGIAIVQRKTQANYY
jgi:hypothetical protein